MASNRSPQPSYLTLTELAFNYTVWVVVGYWIAGGNRVLVSLGLLTARYGCLIWVAAYKPAAAAPSDQRPPQAPERAAPPPCFPAPDAGQKNF